MKTDSNMAVAVLFGNPVALITKKQPCLKLPMKEERFTRSVLGISNSHLRLNSNFIPDPIKTNSIFQTKNIQQRFFRASSSFFSSRLSSLSLIQISSFLWGTQRIERTNERLSVQVTHTAKMGRKAISIFHPPLSPLLSTFHFLASRYYFSRQEEKKMQKMRRPKIPPLLSRKKTFFK